MARQIHNPSLQQLKLLDLQLRNPQMEMVLSDMLLQKFLRDPVAIHPKEVCHQVWAKECHQWTTCLQWQCKVSYHQLQTNQNGSETTIFWPTTTVKKCWLTKYSPFTCTGWVTESTVATTKPCSLMWSFSVSALTSMVGVKKLRAKA